MMWTKREATNHSGSTSRKSMEEWCRFQCSPTSKWRWCSFSQVLREGRLTRVSELLISILIQEWTVRTNSCKEQIYSWCQSEELGCRQKENGGPPNSLEGEEVNINDLGRRSSWWGGGRKDSKPACCATSPSIMFNRSWPSLKGKKPWVGSAATIACNVWSMLGGPW